MADDSLCLGDFVCLYCEESNGYIFNFNSSTAHNRLLTYTNQPREKPLDVPNPHAITFELCAKNRFKLTKEYQKLYNASLKPTAEGNHKLHEELTQAKIAAEAEAEDNIQEQRRQHGRRLRYGQIVQLRHVFTGNYVHVSTTYTSLHDKNNMMVSLNANNGKQAQFQVLPRYKVKSEGDLVQVNDQIILESVKSQGQYLHSSSPWQDEDRSIRCEVNLGVHPSGFTTIRFYHPSGDDRNIVRGGAVVRLFHKELEAYLCAEGVFWERIIENVHLRVRPADQSKPKRMYPPTSAITFWQIESEHSVTDGDTVQWEQQIRLRHLTTRLYLAVTPSGHISLTERGSAPTTVFRLLPVIKEREDVEYETYSRIQHVLTGLWLHALKGDEYERRETHRESGSERALKWDNAPLTKIGVVRECMYDDAFTVQEVKPETIRDLNYVAGAVPVIVNMLRDVQANRAFSLKKTTHILTALKELTEFQVVNGEPTKDRQKLLRNVRLIDLLVQFVMVIQEKAINDHYVNKICTSIYEVLRTYLLGDSRKNELYFARYMEFFETQFDAQGDNGLKATQMITELIRDNRKIVDRISHHDIDGMVELVKDKCNYHYLELLSVLCVCDGIALPENQTYITQKWLVEDKGVGVFLTELGDRIKKDKNKVYVSKTGGQSWIPLHVFVDLDDPEATPDEYRFLEHQLDLFGKLCYGRNDFAIDIITEKLQYLTWKEAFSCLTGDNLPHALRAKYCDLIIGLFVDVGTNRDILDQLNLSFVYADLQHHTSTKKKHRETKSEETMTIFPALRDWMANFLDHNKDMTASDIGHNILIEQVLRLLHYLVKFGYYGEAEDIHTLIEPLLHLLDGRNDKPYPKGTKKVTILSGQTDSAMMKSADDPVAHYRKTARYERCPEAKAIVDAKFRAMEVVELLMNLQFNQRLEKFVGLFKTTEHKGSHSDLFVMVQDRVNVIGHNKTAKDTRKKSMKELKVIIDSTSYFKSDEQITSILLDLAQYDYDKMVTKSIALLLKYYSARADLFEKAVQAQVLLTPKSVEVHHFVQDNISMLKRLSKTKIGPKQAQQVCGVLQKFSELCHMENEPDERHPVNQQILVNFDILHVITNILQQGIDAEVMRSSESTRMVLDATLKLLRFLAKGNKHVQMAIFSFMDTLLGVKGVEEELALALIEVFTGNQTTCLKIRPGQIKKIVQLAADNQEEAAEFIDLLCAIVKIEELNLPLKRNQGYVMKYIMQMYHKVAYVLDKSREERMQILMNHEGPKHLSYLISLVDLLATCAEGENRFIESLCQTIYPLDDILLVLNNRNVENNLKRPYLRFLLWAYLNTASGGIDADLMDLPNKCMPLFRELIDHAQQLTYYTKGSPDQIALLLKKAPSKSTVDRSPEGQAFGTLHFFFDAALPFVEIFYKKGFNISESHDMRTVTDQLANALVQLADEITPLISINNQMKVLIRSVTSILSVANLSAEVMESFLVKHGSGELKTVLNPAQKVYFETYTQEMSLNRRLNIFAGNYSMAFKGENTVREQIGYPSDIPYAEVGEDEDLPLGEEFQELVKWFSTTDKHHYVEKIIQQLFISASHLRIYEKNTPAQIEVDVKCLQVLRALVHNAQVILPESPKHGKKGEYDRQLAEITRVQDALNKSGALTKTMPMIERHNDDIVREYLAFLAAMLYNANRNSQDALEDYFLGTREEMFFSAVKERIDMSVLATKEKRFLVAQFEAKQKEAEAQALALQNTLTAKRNALLALDKMEQKSKKKQIQNGMGVGEVKASLMELRELDRQKKAEMKKGRKMSKGKSDGDSYENPAFLMDDEDEGEPTFHDEGYIELLLRVMASMCDGQNKVIQDYLREQPDNFKSSNLVAEVTAFLSLVYSHISGDNVKLVIQLFATLIEFASGNPTNHHVIYDNNIVDYINFILRSNKHAQVSEKEVLELQEMIGRLLLIILEENLPETETLLLEMKETLDIVSIQKMATHCHQLAQKNASQKEDYLSVGFIYYFVLMRLRDLGPENQPLHGLGKTEEDVTANNSYSSNSKSIEILKDKQIHCIYFRVNDQEVLREEVKEKMKWNVDRSSSSNKLRELTEWSKSIIDDIYYQRRVQKYKVAAFLIKYWNLWNNIVILLSLLINILMLASWDAEKSLGDVDWQSFADNDMKLPSGIHSKVPDIPDWYEKTVLPLSVIHNLFSLLVFISYCLSSRPRIPGRKALEQWWSRRTFGGIRKVPSRRKVREDHLRIELFSFQSIYFIFFLVFSCLGSAFYGYFFAFHLLNIVYNNQLLQRVILAVTMNGKSLLWVSVLGVIIIYIFALIAFAAFRGNMNPEMEDATLYCESLAQCLLTVLRYGLIGELFEKMHVFSSERTFQNFGLQSLFHIMFFIIITTIGLNIIFGIILDTFSELRNLKWTAEMDMKNTCFICNMGSFQFESHGKGFEHHTRHDHNMWAYIFFFIHLEETQENDYTNLEMYVSSMKEKGKLDFFPVYRALVLKAHNEAKSDTKLDDILLKLNNIIKRQRKDDVERHRKRERERQNAWEERNRAAFQDEVEDESSETGGNQL